MIDTHSHMYLDAFDEDREACMAKALEEGVELTLLPNIDVSTIPAVKSMMTKWPNQVKGMMGLHPCNVDADYRSQLDVLRKELDSGAYCAVGEIGIDLYWDKTFVEEQKEAFAIQINWAKELSLPIAIHARDSFDEIFEVLDAHCDERLSGVFHCFTGNEDQLAKALSYPKFYLGIGGVVTFKNSGLDKVLENVDLNRIILETDAPYLTPAPYRGKRNETAYTSLVAKKLAEVFDQPLEKIDEITSENARKLFQL